MQATLHNDMLHDKNNQRNTEIINLLNIQMHLLTW